MLTRLAVLTALALSVLLQGCAGPTVLRPEIPILGPELSVAPSSNEQTKVLFFNNSNRLLFGIDNTGKVGVYVNGKGLGVLQIGEYVQISLSKGKHRIDLIHVDLVAFRSEHELIVGEQTAYVEVAATFVSNSMRTFEALPEGNYLPKPFLPYTRK